MAWTPLLRGALAVTAREAILAIADALATVADPAYDPMGNALFWAYAAHSIDGDATREHFDAAVSRLIESILAGLPLRLYGGVAGAGWVLAHACSGGDEVLEAIDRRLVRAISERAWGGDYDLVGGSVGFGIYFLERLATDPALATAREGLGLVLEHLHATREEREDGITWRTPPELIPHHHRARYPGGACNGGVAHGVPGAVAFLAHAAALDDPPRGAGALLAGATRWLRARAEECSPGGAVDAWISSAARTPARRAAWCYGDPGVAIAWWNAEARCGAAAADPIALAKQAARRPVETCDAIDAGLCHGAAGVAHLFHRGYQATGDRALRDAAIRWFERTLAMRVPGRGLAGFRAWTSDGDGSPLAWRDRPDLLEGIAGIGLALLAATTSIEPAWDRLLLVDLPVRDAQGTRGGVR